MRRIAKWLWFMLGGYLGGATVKTFYSEQEIVLKITQPSDPEKWTQVNYTFSYWVKGNLTKDLLVDDPIMTVQPVIPPSGILSDGLIENPDLELWQGKVPENWQGIK